MAPTVLLLTTLLFLGGASAEYKQEVGRRGWMFSRVAYCPEDDIQRWRCEWCTDELQEFVPVAVITGDTHKTQCYVGLDHSTEEILVVFRGSHNMRNWIDNLRTFIKTNWELTPGKLHKGFLDGYKDLNADLVPHVHNLTANFPDYSLSLYGHSLGGAQSVLASVELGQWYQVTNYHYGSPRVGDKDFATFVNEHANITQVERVVYKKDMVPSLPMSMQGFRHVAREVWYKDGYPDYKLCDYSGEDSSCHSGLWVTLNVNDHSRYYDMPALKDCDIDMEVDPEMVAELNALLSLDRQARELGVFDYDQE